MIQIVNTGYSNILRLKGARLFKKNFAGAATKFKKAGERTTSVFLNGLDPVEIQNLKNAGWPVKEWTAVTQQDDGGNPTETLTNVYLDVQIKPSPAFPINVIIISEHGKQMLDPDDYSIIDRMHIIDVDIVIKKSDYISIHTGQPTCSLYLGDIALTMRQSDFLAEYIEIPDTQIQG